MEQWGRIAAGQTIDARSQYSRSLLRLKSQHLTLTAVFLVHLFITNGLVSGMDIKLFQSITQLLRQQFPNATDDFLLEQARQMYEQELQRQQQQQQSFQHRIEKIEEKYRNLR